ncbi:pyocin activator PrtN family protein [Pseudomonas fragi]|uniref:Transcriptional regulator n=1 Tax=Pseudomonas fragi TaxID=296 RepID=A0A9Q5FS59_PSEFR|nr:pyocin activator PrtN family protein [Pseudomonas fragi]NNB51444.1 transcriptional regulator [Pseudomonas fragi]
MSNTNQNPLRLMPAPDAATVELLYRNFGDVLIPLAKLREQYFRYLNEQTFVAEIISGRIQLPITTLDNSRKATKFAHIRHVAALIDIRAYKADEELARPQGDTQNKDD